MSLAEEITAKIPGVENSYNKLILLVAPSGAGKTKALLEIAARHGFRYINVNLELSRRLLNLNKDQRGFHIPRLMEEFVAAAGRVVLLDNLELLFDPGLSQNPLHLLKLVSRNRIVVATWNGKVESGRLKYAVPGHPEYRGPESVADLVLVG